MPEKYNFDKLERAIISTVAYFDIFSYPVTLAEIWKWLYLPSDDISVSLSDIKNKLQDKNILPVIENKNGFYFLAGRQEIIKTRLGRYFLAEKKFKIALLVCKFLRFVPFIEFVGVCNNLGYNNASKESDIDFFIITKARRLWWTRLITTALVSILGRRRHGQKAADRICLSFYISTDAFDLSSIATQPDDIYLIYWLATLAPIFDRGVYQDFLEKNLWQKKYLLNFFPAKPSCRRSVLDNFFSRISRNIKESILSPSFFDFLENFAQALEFSKMKKFFGSDINSGDKNVILSKSILKMHKTDRRRYYYQQWQQRLEGILR